MVSPIQVAQLIKENSSGADAFLRNVLQSVSGVVDMYKGAAEHIAGITQPGSGSWVPNMIEGIASRGGEIAEKWINYKRDSEVSENKAEIAKAQAKAQDSLARAQAVIASARSGGGLAGAGAGPARPPVPQGAQPAPQRPVASGNGAAAASSAAQPVGQVIPMRAPTQDEQAFGPVLMPSILKLRAGVAAYLQLNGNVVPDERRVQGKNEKGEQIPLGLSPGDAVDRVIKGVEYVQRNKLSVPAFALLDQERWQDIVELLVPDATPEFKTEMARVFAEDTEEGDEEDGEAGAEAAREAERQADPDLRP